LRTSLINPSLINHVPNQPRCKIRLSEEAERNPLKTRRDRHQRIAVAWLVRRYLPRYPFAPEDLRLFPAAVRESATQGVGQEDTPAGLE